VKEKKKKRIGEREERKKKKGRSGPPHCSTPIFCQGRKKEREVVDRARCLPLSTPAHASLTCVMVARGGRGAGRRPFGEEKWGKKEGGGRTRQMLVDLALRGLLLCPGTSGEGGGKEKKNPKERMVRTVIM